MAQFVIKTKFENVFSFSDYKATMTRDLRNNLDQKSCYSLICVRYYTCSWTLEVGLFNDFVYCVIYFMFFYTFGPDSPKSSKTRLFLIGILCYIFLLWSKMVELNENNFSLTTFKMPVAKKVSLQQFCRERFKFIDKCRTVLLGLKIY